MVCYLVDFCCFFLFSSTIWLIWYFFFFTTLVDFLTHVVTVELYLFKMFLQFKYHQGKMMDQRYPAYPKKLYGCCWSCSGLIQHVFIIRGRWWIRDTQLLQKIVRLLLKLFRTRITCFLNFLTQVVTVRLYLFKMFLQFNYIRGRWWIRDAQLILKKCTVAVEVVQDSYNMFHHQWKMMYQRYPDCPKKL